MMSKVWIFVAGFLVFLLLIGGWFIGGLNKAVRLDESVNSSWAQVENQLQRRFDLIPNLVNTVKGYAAHEKETFQNVTEARSQWGKASGINEKINAAQQTSSALSRLLLVAENYPQLKANQNFLNLQTQLEGTENRIAVERKRYNDSVRNLNYFQRSVFGSMFCQMRGVEKRDYFEIEEGVKEVPEVNFN